jgi:hypothetical protein
MWPHYDPDADTDLMLPFYNDDDAQSAVFLFLSTEKIADTPHIERDVIRLLILRRTTSRNR